nr:uncharacterized protein LOC123761864 [Procambarus clarkii]
MMEDDTERDRKLNRASRVYPSKSKRLVPPIVNPVTQERCFLENTDSCVQVPTPFNIDLPRFNLEGNASTSSQIFLCDSASLIQGSNLQAHCADSDSFGSFNFVTLKDLTLLGPDMRNATTQTLYETTEKLPRNPKSVSDIAVKLSIPHGFQAYKKSLSNRLKSHCNSCSSDSNRESSFLKSMNKSNSQKENVIRYVQKSSFKSLKQDDDTLASEKLKRPQHQVVGFLEDHAEFGSDWMEAIDFRGRYTPSVLESTVDGSIVKGARRYVNKHIRNTHGSFFPLRCGYCVFLGQDHNQLRHHIRKKHGTSKYRIIDIPPMLADHDQSEDKSSIMDDDLESIEDESNASQTRTLLCPLCGKSLKVRRLIYNYIFKTLKLTLTLRDQQPKNCVLCFTLTLNSAKLSLYDATLIVFIKSKLVAYGYVWYHGDRNKIAYTDICIKVQCLMRMRHVVGVEDDEIKDASLQMGQVLPDHQKDLGIHQHVGEGFQWQATHPGPTSTGPILLPHETGVGMQPAEVAGTCNFTCRFLPFWLPWWQRICVLVPCLLQPCGSFPLLELSLDWLELDVEALEATVGSGALPGPVHCPPRLGLHCFFMFFVFYVPFSLLLLSLQVFIEESDGDAMVEDVTPYLKLITAKYGVRQPKKEGKWMRQYRCPHCDYTCNFNSSYNRHLRLHNGVKPYKCGYCDFHARESYVVRKHCSKSHKGKKTIIENDNNFKAPYRYETGVKNETNIRADGNDEMEKEFNSIITSDFTFPLKSRAKSEKKSTSKLEIKYYNDNGARLEKHEENEHLSGNVLPSFSLRTKNRSHGDIGLKKILCTDTGKGKKITKPCLPRFKSQSGQKFKPVGGLKKVYPHVEVLKYQTTNVPALYMTESKSLEHVEEMMEIHTAKQVNNEIMTGELRKPDSLLKTFCFEDEKDQHIQRDGRQMPKPTFSPQGSLAIKVKTFKRCQDPQTDMTKMSNKGGYKKADTCDKTLQQQNDKLLCEQNIDSCNLSQKNDNYCSISLSIPKINNKYEKTVIIHLSTLDSELLEIDKISYSPYGEVQESTSVNCKHSEVTKQGTYGSHRSCIFRDLGKKYNCELINAGDSKTGNKSKSNVALEKAPKADCQENLESCCEAEPMLTHPTEGLEKNLYTHIAFLTDSRVQRLNNCLSATPGVMTRDLLALDYSNSEYFSSDKVRLMMMKKKGGRIKCRECGVATTYRAFYKHAKKHFNIKPFKCGYCSYRSIEKSKIRVHSTFCHPSNPCIILKLSPETAGINVNAAHLNNNNKCVVVEAENNSKYFSLPTSGNNSLVSCISKNSLSSTSSSIIYSTTNSLWSTANLASNSLGATGNSANYSLKSAENSASNLIGSKVNSVSNSPGSTANSVSNSPGSTANSVSNSPGSTANSVSNSPGSTANSVSNLSKLTANLASNSLGLTANSLVASKNNTLEQLNPTTKQPALGTGSAPHMIGSTSQKQHPFQCPICMKFLQKHMPSIRRHLYSHFGYKPYKCGYCNFSGIGQSEVRAHHVIHGFTKLPKVEHSGIPMPSDLIPYVSNILGNRGGRPLHKKRGHMCLQNSASQLQQSQSQWKKSETVSTEEFTAIYLAQEISQQELV